MLIHSFADSLSGGKCSRPFPVLPIWRRFCLWPGRNNLNTLIWRGSNHFSRFLLISTLSVTTTYFHDLFTDLSSYVIFFILFLHPLVLALMFFGHTNELLAFPHGSNENTEQAWNRHRAPPSFDYELSNFHSFDRSYNMSYFEDPTA